jgi:hypothetical protein
MKRQLNKHALTLAGIYAAIQFVVTLCPMTFILPWIGGYVTLGIISAPVIGYLLGPRYGGFAVLLGSLIGTIFDPWAAVLSYFTPLAPTISALVAGMLRTQRFRLVSIIFLIAVCLFLFSPVGWLSWSFLWFDFITLGFTLLILFPSIKRRLVQGLVFPPSRIDILTILSVWSLVFIGIMADHVVFSVIGAFYYLWLPPALVSGFYNPVAFLYPTERIILSVIGLVVALIAPKTSLYLEDSRLSKNNEGSAKKLEPTEQSSLSKIHEANMRDT